MNKQYQICKWLLIFSVGLAFASQCFGQAPLQFTEVAQSVGITQRAFNRADMAGGSAWLDYDRDGDQDLVLSGGDTGNRLYRNEGNGTFTDVTVAAGFIIPNSFSTQGVVTGDIDNDGYREIFVGTWWHERNFLFRNNGDGTFSDITLSSGLGLDSVWTPAASFGDYDNDGLLDLYSANYVYDPEITKDSLGNQNGFAHRCDGNILWHNNGNGTFSNITPAVLADTGCGLATIFTDFDQDRDVDLWVANDFGGWIAPNILFQNDPGPSFQDVGSAAGVDHGIYGMGFAVGDYDHDLDLDYYITNIGANLLHQNQGNGVFSEQAYAVGVPGDSLSNAMSTGWGTFFLDADNDSWQDLFCANGYISMIDIFTNAEADPDRLWLNNGNGTFSDITFSANLGDTARARGASYCDFDQDGDLDILVNVVVGDTINSPHFSKLYRNDLNSNQHWLQVELEGVWSNRDGYGAHIQIAANGTRWVHEISGGSSHISQNSSIAHFGLGNSSSVDSLTVYWPSGTVQTFTGLPADTMLLIREDSLALSSTRPFSFPLLAYPNPFQETITFSLQDFGLEPMTCRIFDAKGSLVRTYHLPTNHQHEWVWDGRNEQGKQLDNGIYLVELRNSWGRKGIKIAKVAGR